MTDVYSYSKKNYSALLDTLRHLAKIPAPSHMEDERAEACKSLLLSFGAENVYIDSAKNVIYPICCEGKSRITVMAAHLDTVFPDTEPFLLFEDDERIYCPGIGDDTASVAVLLMTAKYLTENKAEPEDGLMIVFNSCEEGLGNLKGTKQLFKDYDGRIARFLTLDSSLDCIYNSCVGSHRYRVTVKTEGGHSFSKFGNKNAIAELSKIVSEIYGIAVPESAGEKTTYNVGEISGGTSVNTISQEAEMLCEYRSSSLECLEIMREKFLGIFENAKGNGVEVVYEKIGDRPCSASVSGTEMSRLSELCEGVLSRLTDSPVCFKSASTDCNIPMSLGIPAVCFGVYRGGGAHTREEYILKDSLLTGLCASIEIALGLCSEK